MKPPLRRLTSQAASGFRPSNIFDLSDPQADHHTSKLLELIMNSSYRSLWNDSTGTFVAVPENASRAGKKTSSRTNATGANTRFTLQALAVSVMLAFGTNALAQPTGGVVAAGAASIITGATSTTINQTTQNAVINWQRFNIATGQSVHFVEPNSSSIALNRVLGSNPSSILGSLSANGKVFLVNPNGILFGQGASVSVGGLLASTLDISNSDFLAGNYKFSGNGSGAVLNQGAISADGGYVALLGANVSNEGVISAQLGSVVLAAGSVMTMDVAGDGLLNIAVNEGAVNALVQNGGLIRADGGQVLLTAKSAGSLLQSAVNNTGVVQAQTLVTGENGSIMLMGDMQTGTVNVGGTLDASAPNGGDGGFIETSAARVKIADDTLIRTQSAQGRAGMWLIDPVDFTIASSGGDMTPGTLATALAGNVTIESNSGTVGGVNGDINVNNDVTWGAATTLTLNAVNDVNFNAAVTATNGGSLVANAGHDIAVAAGVVTGITTTGGNITWTAGQDIQVNSNLPGQTGITATFAAGDSGNITWVAGRDVNINAEVTATGGDFTVCCGRDLRVNDAVTTTDGDVLLNAGRDIVIAAAMTTTRGDVLLRTGNEPSAEVPGLIGGTVVFNGGNYTVTGAVGTPVAVTVDYTPSAYDAPTNYITNFILTDATLTSRMLVFAQGNDKVYDGNTNATLTFRGDPTTGGDITLVAGTGTFDDKNVAPDIGITYTGYSLGGADAAQFALWGVCGAVAGSGRTSADITPAPLTLQANNASKVYGTTFTPANTAFTTLVAPVAGETVTSVLETSTGSAPTASVAGSTYPIVITPGSATGANGFVATNYTINYVDGNLAVTPAPLVLTANDATKVYGTTFMPAGTAFTQTGLVNSDTVTSVVETTTGTPPTASVAGSPYPIVITPGSAAGSFTATNYTISYVDGALTVTPAPLTLTANDATKAYGTTFTPAGTAFTHTGLLNGDTVTSVVETTTGSPPTASVAGSPYPIVITPGSSTGTFIPTNYVITYVDGRLTVTPVPLTITANDATKTYGQTLVLPDTDFTTTGLVNGDTVTSVPETSAGTAATAPVVGSPYAITPGNATGTYVPGNYVVTYVDGMLYVLPSVVVPPVFLPPVVTPDVGPNPWPPVVVLPLIPPQLTTLAPPVVLSPTPVPVVVSPPKERVEPVVQPVPQPYVAPVRPRKQDRN
jgi:filamentous hemagglutinin family protein